MRALLTLALVVLTMRAFAAEAPADNAPLAPLPEGDAGLSAKYPGDANIAKDPAVVFADDFENGKTNAINAWGDIAYPETAENVHGGKRSMELKLVRPGPQAAGLGYYHHLDKGCDTLFLRYYAKYAKDTELFHGGTHNGGSIFARAEGQPDAKPGIPADGKNEYTVLLDTWRSDTKTASPGSLATYVYHPEQRHQWGEHFFPNGHLLPYTEKKPEFFFGKQFKARPELIPPLDKWVCYELMVKANTPGKRDGRIAFWIDGKLAADFPNLRLRDVPELKANRLGLGLYTQNDQVNKTVTMWYDDVVAATTYIGPRVDKDQKNATPKPAGK